MLGPDPNPSHWAPPTGDWDRPRAWVVFSDLHLSPATSKTCMEVLDTVHGEAMRRDAGIIFLGAPARRPMPEGASEEGKGAPPAPSPRGMI